MPLTDTSLKRLENVEPVLVSIIKEAIGRVSMNVQIAEGSRSYEQQKKNVAKGVSQTLKSKHIDPDGAGPKKARAVDVAIIDAEGKYVTNLKHYRAFANVVLQVAKEKGVKVVWGGNWKTLVDGPHFELV